MIVKYISIILGTMFEIYCINKFTSIYLPKKEIKKYKFYLIFIIISAFYISKSFFLNGVSMAIASLIAKFLFAQLYESKQYVKMIISIFLSVLYVSSELLFGGIFMLISGDTHLMVNTSPEAYAIGTILSKFFVFMIIMICQSKKKSIAISNITPKYLALLSVLPITTIILSILMYQIILVIESSNIKLTFVFANILLILSNAITFEIIHNQNKLAKSEYELNLLKNSVKEQTKHYEALKLSQEEIRQMRHNMKTICIGTIAELKEGRTENAIEQLQSNIDVIEKSSKVIDTGHPSIDSIIENKLNICDELNINIHLSYQYKEPITINEIEIAVIIGNILDNAIESCQKINNTDTDIWGSIIVNKQNIIIDIKNTTTDSNNFMTSKKDKISHGFGLKSISHIAKKFNGYAKFTFENNEFRAFVILDN